jgi:hypothetical protein
MASPPLFPVSCGACTTNYGGCFTQCQARINKLDAGDVCAGNVCVSGLLQSGVAHLQALAAQTVSVDVIQPLDPVPGVVQLPSVALGSLAFSANPLAALLNGQQLQPSVVTAPGLVPRTTACGSLIYMTGGQTFLLDSAANPGAFYFFYNAGAVAAALSCSQFGGIQKGAAAPVASYSVAPGGTGALMNAGASIWILLLGA